VTAAKPVGYNSYNKIMQCNANSCNIGLARKYASSYATFALTCCVL